MPILKLADSLWAATAKPAAELPTPVCSIKSYPFYRFHKVGIKIAVAWKEFRDRSEANV